MRNLGFFFFFFFSSLHVSHCTTTLADLPAERLGVRAITHTKRGKSYTLAVKCACIPAYADSEAVYVYTRCSCTAEPEGTITCLYLHHIHAHERVLVFEKADDPVGSSEARGRALVFHLAGNPTSMIVTVTTRV